MATCMSSERYLWLLLLLMNRWEARRLCLYTLQLSDKIPVLGDWPALPACLANRQRVHYLVDLRLATFASVPWGAVGRCHLRLVSNQVSCFIKLVQTCLF